MSIQQIKAQLQAIPLLAAVTIDGETATTVDTADLITAVVKPNIPDVYPLNRDNDGAFPAATYTLVSSQPQYLNGCKISQQDTYVLSVWHTDYDNLVALRKTVIADFGQSPYGFEITDQQQSYNEDEKSYQVDLEITIAAANSNAQGEMPAAMLYLLGTQANESELDNQIRQRVTSRYAITLITTNNNIAELREAVKNKLMGYQTTPVHFEMQYQEGQPAGNQGGLQIWQETYYDSINTKAAN